jgi:hypothetical protein
MIMYCIAGCDLHLWHGNSMIIAYFLFPIAFVFFELILNVLIEIKRLILNLVSATIQDYLLTLLMGSYKIKIKERECE